MVNYIQEGDRLQVTAGVGGITSGAVVLVGTKVTVAVTSALESEVAVVATAGVYEIAKATGAVTKGDALYWDADNSVLTKTSLGNTLAGYAFTSQDSGDATVQVCLNEGVNGSAETQQAANEAALTGTLTGTTDGTLADIAAIELSTSDVYTDAAVNTAVNTAITAANLQIKELQTTLNGLLTKLKAAGIMAADA